MDDSVVTRQQCSSYFYFLYETTDIVMKYEAFEQLVTSRRSIHPPQFTSDPVSDEDILALLELANWAPNHKKTEPWRFKIFTGNSLERLSEAFEEYYLENTPVEKRNPIKLKKQKNRPLQCSHIIFIIMKRSDHIKLPEWEEIAAVSCAVQNFWLGCNTKGIGCYWSSPAAVIKAQKEILDLAEDEVYLGQLYVGKVNADLKLDAERGSIEDKISWIRD